MEFHICCCTDDNYAQHCAAMLCSLLENNKKVGDISIHILINELSLDNKKNINDLVRRYGATCIFYKVDSRKLQGVKYRKFRPLSEAAYYRVLLASVLPVTLSRVLYLDCDLIVVGNLKKIFDIELDNYSLAAVEEPVEISEDHRSQLSIPYGNSYFNSGVLLVNLDYWRSHNSEQKLIEFSRRERFVYCHDQDALNYVFKASWYKLPPKYNKSNIATLDNIKFATLIDLYEYKKRPLIIHYIDEPKPWQEIFLMRNRKLYYKYLALSGWKEKRNKLNNQKKILLYKNAIMYYIKSLLYVLGLLHLTKKISISVLGRISKKT